uniref:Protein croquemort n=1 Tax=Caenorhabditis tropicalis TaxID=1561998 RepID=A0A1I7USA7_9PELO
MIYVKRTVPMPGLFKLILDAFMIVMKVQPLKKTTVCEILLDSYKDPALEFLHTPFFRFLKNALDLKTPDFPDLGYFPKYNKTSDGDYVIMTGKDDIKNIGQIVSWNNWTELPWWRTPETREFKGSGDGINQRPGIGKNDKYEMYQPLACRKYSLEYSGQEGHIYGIPTLGYSFELDSYDGVANFGYRYPNPEKALTGHTLSANFRVQFNVPLYPNTGSHLWSYVPTKIVPTFWLDLDVEVQDYALNFFYLAVVVSQKAVFIISIVCLTLSALLTGLIMFKIIKKRHDLKVRTAKKLKTEESIFTNHMSRL